jgi:hypothetical protein
MRSKKTAHPFLLAKNQAKLRQQPWQLTREEYDQLWQGKEDQRGRSSSSLSLCRLDFNKAWQKDNCVLMSRGEFRKKMNKQNRESKAQEEK